MSTLSTGEVEAFDDEVGLGVVRAGDERFPFHCIEIADGTRSIDVGAAVTFVVIDRFGRREAGSLTAR